MKKRRQRTKLVSPEEVAISHCVKNEDPSGFLKVLISREIGEFYFQNFNYLKYVLYFDKSYKIQLAGGGVIRSF